MDETLVKAIEKLISLKGECTFGLLGDLDADSLTMTQINYLRKINQLKETTISELSEQMALSKPTITESVKKLQKSGYIIKHQCQSDARRYYIELTEKGSRLANIEKLSIIKLVDRIATQLSIEEIRILIGVIESIH